MNRLAQIVEGEGVVGEGIEEDDVPGERCLRRFQDPVTPYIRWTCGCA